MLEMVTWVASGLFVEELRCGGGIHDGGPDLLFRGDRSLGHCVVRHPRIELAAGYEAENGGNQASSDRSDDPDRDVGFVALVCENLDTQCRAIEHGGVLSTVEQRLAYQVMDDCSQSTFGTNCRLGAPPQLVVVTGQQVGVWVALASGGVCSAL